MLPFSVNDDLLLPSSMSDDMMLPSSANDDSVMPTGGRAGLLPAPEEWAEVKLYPPKDCDEFNWMLG